MIRTIKWLITVACICAVILLMSIESDNSSQTKLNKSLPPVQLTDMVTGEKVQLNMMEGHFLLNIWGSWCVACAREHDFLLQLQKADIRIVGISYMDSSINALKWLAEKGNPYTHSLIDADGVLGKWLDIKGAPESYLVDSAGKILYKHTGILNEANWPLIAAQYKTIK